MDEDRYDKEELAKALKNFDGDLVIEDSDEHRREEIETLVGRKVKTLSEVEGRELVERPPYLGAGATLSALSCLAALAPNKPPGPEYVLNLRSRKKLPQSKNSPCSCGSGKKFKKCCLGTIDHG